MTNSGFLNDIRKIAEEISAREGCRLYDLEFVGTAIGRTLRVYIDKEGVESVSIEDCSNVSRALNLRLDVEDVVPGGAYSLEVSSPGLERVLRERWHFEQAAGKKIQLKTFAPLLDFNPDRPELAKSRQISGRLAAVTDDGVRVKPDDGEEVLIPLDAVTKAHVVFEFEAGKATPKGKQKKKR